MKCINYFALFIGLLITEVYVQEYIPKHLRTKYGALSENSAVQQPGVKTFTKTKTTNTKTAGVKTGGSPYGGSTYSNNQSKYKGGCNAEPATPMNAGVRCSAFSGCHANCIPNYQFPNGESQLFITCDAGSWIIQGTEWDTIPACEPKCLPGCQNNGICVAPNQCNCPENFSGPQCQYENKPCLNYPPSPLNAKRMCRSSTCTITCMAGHQFPDGSSITSMICKNGNWVPAKEGWPSIPDCKATCNPPCENGGNCLSFNVCQCPQDLRGPQCQYLTTACHARKLQFNGGYKCSGNADSFSCSLTCPAGIHFEFNPEPSYTCTYDTGIFLPSPIPQCVFGENMEIIPLGGSSHTFYKTHNSTYSTNSQKQFKNGYGGTKTKYTDPNGHTNDSNMEFAPLGHYGQTQDNFVIVEEKRPEPGICFTWGGSHYKTFDGKVFSVQSDCAHTLAKDSIDNTFNIVIVNNPCKNSLDDCYRIIKIYLQDKEYVLKKSDKGQPIFVSPTKILPIPGQLPGIRAEMSAHYIVISLDSIGAKIKWDGQQLVQIEVNEGLWNRTAGLCGNIDGNPDNDMMAKDGSKPKTLVTLAKSWQVDTLEDACQSVPSEELVCQDTGIKGSKPHRAAEFCKKLLNDKRFAPCQAVMDISVLMDACKWDYCSCPSSDPTECACNTLNVYVRGCSQKGIKTLAKWRDENTCPMKCSGGRVYMSCAPSGGQPVCGASIEKSENGEICEEGCYCPIGTVLHNGNCITKDKCPCKLRGKEFATGVSVPKDCNTCTCSEGQWICTQVSCGARCSAIGDPHYQTFDGKRFDFMGQCTYYLMKADNFSIEAENVACSGTISQAMNFPTSIASGLPSCTKTVTVRAAGQNIKLKQNHEIVVNGLDVTKIPYKIAGITIKSVSSIFLLVELPNGIQVWWDGVTRAYIDVPAKFKGNTKGLCGTFNDNQKDDFITPENDIEQSVIPFANKWKTEEKCNDIPDKLKSHPCDVNIQNKATAEKHCKKIKSDIFGDCHFFVDPEPYYHDCMYDLCSCEDKISKCLCPMMAAYAAECAAKGVKINWRSEIHECGISCPTGQTYQVCGNPCTRTCFDIASKPDCQQQCVEGCNCPEGETMDDHGECIPIGQCGCQYDGIDFPAAYKEVRPASKGLELCTCANGIWNCRLAKPNDIQSFPQASDLKSKCNATKNFVFTTCEDIEPVTCKNMHSKDEYSAGVCHAGCECKSGYVLDTRSKTCVKPTECPCHHGGRSYKENALVQNDCNTCKCKNGTWDCTDRLCSSECSAWGDSHFKTLDGKVYDYQGQCDYVLAKGVLSADDTFDITIQNVPCGTLGVSCSKSITVKIGSGTQQEGITLTRDKKTPDRIFKRFTVRNKDLFVIIEAPDLGLIVHWDKGTRVYVKVDPRWKNKVKGLCGNYNDNESDDFQTPSGGITEASAQLFGDSWKLQAYCPDAQEVSDTCEQRPDRKMWALKECGILKSSTFAPCHSEVPVEGYLEKCVFDSCACDQGGDCECLCTAIAAYSQECNNRGVPIKWRSQHLCPIQCDERCSQYSPCVSTCPVETCDNLLVQSPLSKLCKQDTCIEGCEPKPCPDNQIYQNSSLLDCVPRSVCNKPECLVVNETTYFEGDLMEEDECHSCYCSRAKKTCKGQPCAPMLTTLIPDPITHQLEQLSMCKPGWTDWINQDKISGTATKTKNVQSTKYSDVEPLPTDVLMNNLNGKARCDLEEMVGIECRSVKTHISAKETGMDVECSLEKGLICKSKKGHRPCPDFEIRVLCKCAEETTEATITTVTACDSRKPNEEFPGDCHKFYQCAPGMNGLGLVEKTCGADMMYNPQTMICDWPNNVAAIKPECDVEEGREEIQNSLVEAEPERCPPGQTYDECAIQCDKLCLHYSYTVKEANFCKGNQLCESGCVSAEKQLSCPIGQVWTNNITCVAIHDCMCTSHDGKPIKPGTVYKESECMLCQCIDNYYTCDKSACEDEAEDQKHFVVTHEVEDKVTKEIGIITKPTVIIPSTVTPPKECDPDMFMDLMQGDQPLPDSAFTASSILSNAFAPENARIDSKVSGNSGGSWTPKTSDKDQYLQINLGHLEPIYGVVIKGSPLYSEYVTSFKVLYSHQENDTFSYVQDRTKEPQLFRGPLDGNTPVKHIFFEPIEAQIIRINPQTWSNGISLRVELIGCGQKQTTTPAYEFITIPTNKAELCVESMGLGEGTMSDQQIIVSSEYGPYNSKQNLKIDGNNAWRPITNSPSEFIEFNFLEPRNLTGFITKGGPNGWITAFHVKYAHAEKQWNPIIDVLLTEKTFLGNFDESTPHTNNFEMPILATFIQIIPMKWHKNIELRIEMLGCYSPYPIMKAPVATEPPSPCNHCPGAPAAGMELEACRCKAHLWWDGENCVSRSQCPCMVGHIPYAIGTVFEKEDCSQCICKLGGISHCSQKSCESCEKGLRSTVTSTCNCVCLPCDEGLTLCPTSNICINSTSWCDGIRDCPDDEINCMTTPLPTESVITTIEPLMKTTKINQVLAAKCPKLTCPPGYKSVEKKLSKSEKLHSNLSTMFSTYGRKGGTKTSNYTPRKNGSKGVKGYKNALQRPNNLEIMKDQECPEFKCVSEKLPPPYIPGKPCPPTNCPPGFVPEFVSEENKKPCPKYECMPPPPPDAICNVTGRTFNTFDKTEYKYDICNHILARDLENLEWDISIKKNCTSQCSRNLVIHHNDHKFVLHPDLSVEYDGYKYTVAQTKKIGSQSQFFTISRLGNTLLFVSNHYGFWVIWDTQGNVKVGVSGKLEHKVDGLCGYFNNIAADDKRKPDGTEARTTADFGDSWAQADEAIVCEAKACPIHIQNKAWDMCNQVKGQVLSACAKSLDVDAFVSRCLETTCACLENAQENSTAEDNCRCKTLETFVVDCMTADNDIELTDWRMLHDCPAPCDSPLVHHDCYRRRCEPTCETISDPNICPKISNVCFPGCYCPPGLVRKGDTCIKSSTCRDCECNVLPHLQYVTYDESNFTINGNCVYVMSRDVLEKYHDEHQFQVLITNAPCRDKAEKMCVGKITILYQGHKIHVYYDNIKNKLKMVVDSERIEDFEEIADWANVRETKSKHFKILLTKTQIEVSVYFPSLGVSVKAPSHKYGGKLEGLCGDCNKDPDNDMNMPDGGVARDVEELGPSWLYDKLPGMTKETCSNKPLDVCEPLPIEQDPCIQLVDVERFAQCHPLLDPSMFIEWCRKDTCGDRPEQACTAISAYARECLSSGFCINWHSDLCPAAKCSSDQEYKPCGPSCPNTCDSIKDKSKAKQCVNVPTDGCFCPEGKVMMNNTCIPEKQCIVCDKEGHHPGDSWQKDACTSCECEGTSVKCETQHCPAVDTVCQLGFTAVKLTKEQNECCDRFICVPAATVSPTCDPPQQLNCAPGQLMKLDTRPDGCQQFICQCKPIEDCEKVNTTGDSSMEDGMVKVINNSGCCPSIDLVCKSELCAKPLECQEFYKSKETVVPGKCCSVFTCESPQKCVVEFEYIADEKGGERTRSLYEKQRILKDVDESWQDGPCRDCKCYGSNSTGYHSVCSITECPLLTSNADYMDYELTTTPTTGHCCPDIKRSGCKHNGKVYKIGDKWAATQDYCTNMECVDTSAYGIQKSTQITNCESNCELGFEYKPATVESKECCGACKPVACVADGVVKEVGQEWSSSDHCTNYFCLNINGSMQIQSVMVVCAEVPTEHLLEFVYEFISIDNECCKKHKMTACKSGNDVYTVGQIWPSPDGDKCKKITCVENSLGELTKQDSIETCNKDCAKGWKYTEVSNACCGECVQVACVVGDEFKLPAQNWTSVDNCTTFTCEKYLDQFTVNSHQDACPMIDDCPEANIYVKGCCNYCNVTSQSQSQCMPEEMSESKSIGLIKSERQPHGICANKEPLQGFTECVGTCHSSTFFNAKSGSHESICSCCVATKYAPLLIELTCEDGYKFKKQVAVPSSCSCEGCAAEKYTKNPLIKSGIKTG